MIINGPFRDISFNSFTGDLPQSFTSLSNVTDIYMQNNQFTGTIDVLANLPLKNLEYPTIKLYVLQRKRHFEHFASQTTHSDVHLQLLHIYFCNRLINCTLSTRPSEWFGPANKSSQGSTHSSITVFKSQCNLNSLKEVTNFMLQITE